MRGEQSEISPFIFSYQKVYNKNSINNVNNVCVLAASITSRQSQTKADANRSNNYSKTHMTMNDITGKSMKLHFYPG